MAEITHPLPPFADEKVIKKLRNGSGNYKVYIYLAHGRSLTVAEAREGEFPLTQDLKARIGDLKNKYGVPISSMRVVKDGKIKTYKRYWITGAVPELDSSILLQDGEL